MKKTIVAALSLASLLAQAQAQTQVQAQAQTQAQSKAQSQPPVRHPNWQNKDLATDTLFGISTEKAYADLLVHKKSRTVLVAVIDSGVDTTHEDLKSIIWINPKERPDGKDDDHNGYIDDLHGWDFIGGPHGDVNQDNLELTRLVRRDKPFYDSLSAAGIPPAYQSKYDAFRKMEADYDRQWKLATGNLKGMELFKATLDSLLQRIGTDSPSVAILKGYQPRDKREAHVQDVVLSQLADNPDFGVFKKGFNRAYDHYKDQVDHSLNLAFDPRPIVGDDYANVNQRDYGNNDVTGPDAHHGTHVSGIIGAVRNNGIGIDGIADNVRIMIVRTVPDGDERDKDVANAIRYAADNGAKVFNMSFGKAYSPDKAAVDAAVRYAMSKDVLIVHAAGNSGESLDSNYNYPSRKYLDGSGQADGWIEVGASGEKDDSTLPARFSNYGRTTVDVFAPGVQVYSSIPGSDYAYYSGTSMATPVVAGLAALIREYYPKLKAAEVKDIIMKSVVKREILKDKCISGGVVNAYNALKLAAHYKGG